MRNPHRKKPRDVIINLPPHQLRQVIRWLVADESYTSIQVKMAAEFGVETSIQTISVFWRKYVAPEVDHREEFIRRTVRTEWQERLNTSAPTAPSL